ncbi:MAG: CRISPR system precrRNA processing endoribonuclease RAMP protein Cas6 [Paracoccaceae bacterium]
MQSFTAHRLRFVTEVQTEIELNEHQGSAIRGALFHALRDRFCSFADDDRIQCVDCTLATTCPVAKLVSTLAPDHPRGQDRPRPYTLQPPLPGSGHPVDHPSGYVNFRYRPGEALTFGLTLYADAMALFPYVVLATTVLEESGLGRRLQHADGRWRRGTLTVREIWAENPLTGERQAVLRQGEHQVQVPDIPVTHDQVLAKTSESLPPAPRGAPSQARLRFLTPTRLIDDGQLVKPEAFAFRPLLHRLITRLEDLSGLFSDHRLALDVPQLLEAAERVAVVDNRLTWEELTSYSTRRRTTSPTSGLLGTVILEALDWAPFWPWLLWGQFVHVGKDAVKGNGMYTLTAEV